MDIGAYIQIDNLSKVMEENNINVPRLRGLRMREAYMEKIYRENVFYLTRWISDCGFHGWKWSEDDGRMQSMADITNGITDKFKEIYALILCDLGIEKFERSQE